MKERLDVMLVNRGLATSREKAKAIIMSGIVYVDGQKEDKAGSMFEETGKCGGARNNAEVCQPWRSETGEGNDAFRRVSHRERSAWMWDLRRVDLRTACFRTAQLRSMRLMSDMDSSTWKLRNDPRVVCMEKTNIRYVTPDDIEDKIGLSSIDVSFISLTKVLGPVKALLTDDGQVVCLIKPQFEAGREKVGKKGVVREKNTHLEVIRKVMEFASEIGFEILNLEFSPIKGPEGNIEYLLHLQNHTDGQIRGEFPVDEEAVVESAHQTLDK